MPLHCESDSSAKLKVSKYIQIISDRKKEKEDNLTCFVCVLAVRSRIYYMLDKYHSSKHNFHISTGTNDRWADCCL